MTEDHERRLAQSWMGNAESWTEAVRAGRIESRHLVTDLAVVDAVLACGGSKVLDVGCGEGWLARSLSRNGRDVVGFDGSARLVDRARELGDGSFVVLTYDAFSDDPARVGADHDVAVSNFSLLGEHIGGLLRALRRAVVPGGRLVIQTVHPDTVADRPGQDGWREETFERLAPLEFSAMPWYFRTLESWIGELERSGWRNVLVLEPRYPSTGEVASVILLAENQDS
jgi:SAM-dependent methyltransferase